MRFITNRQIVAAIAAASCIAVTASASAGAMPATDQSDAAQSGANAGQRAGARAAYPPSGFTVGDRAQPGRTVQSTYPPSGFNGGDSPADRGRAPTAEPTTIQVVRPERTIVRNVDEALPLILSGSALLLVLAGLGTTLIRTGIVPRLGRSD
jgi:hypothetical protein